MQFMHNQLLTTMERVTDSGYVNLNELEVGGGLESRGIGAERTVDILEDPIT